VRVAAAAKPSSKTSFSSKASSKSRAPTTSFADPRSTSTGRAWAQPSLLWCLSLSRILCSNHDAIAVGRRPATSLGTKLGCEAERARPSSAVRARERSPNHSPSGNMLSYFIPTSETNPGETCHRGDHAGRAR
jgi:hypothetical protein